MHQFQILLRAAALSSSLVLLPVSVSADLDVSALAAQLPEKGEFHLALFNGDERDGFMRLGWFHEGEKLIVYDRTMMPSAEVYETYRASMSAGDLSPESVAIRFHQGTAILNINASLEGSEISGQRMVQRIGSPDETTEFSLEQPDGTLLRALTFVLPLVLSTEPGQEISYTWYSPLAGVVDEVTLSSEDGGEVVTPAGTFATTVWKLRGGSPENDIYFSRGDESGIVRIDVLGQPLKFMAVNQP